VAAFLANVGVNAGHAARSPLFDDGTFALLPIPEPHPWHAPMVRFGDLEHLRHHAPSGWTRHAVHLDPDFESTVPTYGDNCRTAGRAFSLRTAAPGDVIVFLARLHPRREAAGFYLVGSLEVEAVLRDVTHDPGPGWWDGNAHIRRARALRKWDSFWLFKGTRNSAQFGRAIRFARAEAAALFGDGWSWPGHRTELQTIGSHTRAVRRVEGAGEEWLRAACPF
jgi:hypothetical protein